jgi:hypothetical protein
MQTNATLCRILLGHNVHMELCHFAQTMRTNVKRSCGTWTNGMGTRTTALIAGPATRELRK